MSMELEIRKHFEQWAGINLSTTPDTVVTEDVNAVGPNYECVGYTAESVIAGKRRAYFLLTSDYEEGVKHIALHAEVRKIQTSTKPVNTEQLTSGVDDG